MSLRSHSEPPTPSFSLSQKQTKSPLKAKRGRPPGSLTRSLKTKHSPELSTTSCKARLIAPDMSYTRFTAPISSAPTPSRKPTHATPSPSSPATSTSTKLAAYGRNDDQAGLHAIQTQDQGTQCSIPTPPTSPHICTTAANSPQVIIFEARWDKLRLVPEARFRDIEGHINYHRFAIPPHSDRFVLWQRNTPNPQAQSLSKELLKFPGEIYWAMLRCGSCGVPVDRGGY